MDTSATTNSTLKSNMTCEQLVTVALDIGEQMIICGAEANRVEDSITRICEAYGAVRSDVFSITSYISLSVTDSSGHTAGASRRVRSYSHDLDRLEYLNAISRYVCSNTPEYNNIDKETENITKSRNFPWYIILLGYIFACFAFAIFFGGKFIDGAFAALLAIPAYFIDRSMKKYHINPIIYNFFCCFLGGAAVAVISKCGIPILVDKVIIGLVMIYIPGVQLTNSIRDILCGDIMSGLLRLIEAVILAISIAAGFATSVLLINNLFTM